MFDRPGSSSVQLSDRQFFVRAAGGDEPAAPMAVLLGIGLWSKSIDCRPIWIEDQRGERIAFFIGTVIDEETRQVVTGTRTFPHVASNPDDDLMRAFERFAYRFSGSWLLVFVSSETRRVYLDPCGTLGLVFDRAARVAASTAASLLSFGEYQARFRRDLFNALDVVHMGWFPGTITAHQGVERVLPNHYLDLTTWRSHRHWPSAGKISRYRDRMAALDAVSRSIAAQCSALLKRGSVAAALTAGMDSRFVLASTRALKPRVTYATVRSAWNRVDAYGASQLVSLYGAPHKVLPHRRATREMQMTWLYNAGHNVGGTNLKAHPSIKPLAEFDYFMGGVSGEVGRGFWYREIDARRQTISAEELLSRMGLPPVEPVLRDIERWIYQAPVMDIDQLLDLAYIELRLGSWGFASAYTDHPATPIQPFVSRQSYELMIGMEREHKAGTPFREWMMLREPDLLSIPVNSYGDARDALTLAMKLVQPHRVVNKIRRARASAASPGQRRAR